MTTFPQDNKHWQPYKNSVWGKASFSPYLFLCINLSLWSLIRYYPRFDILSIQYNLYVIRSDACERMINQLNLVEWLVNGVLGDYGCLSPYSLEYATALLMNLSLRKSAKKRLNEWMKEWKNEWMNEWMNEWIPPSSYIPIREDIWLLFSIQFNSLCRFTKPDVNILSCLETLLEYENPRVIRIVNSQMII